MLTSQQFKIKSSLGQARLHTHRSGNRQSRNRGGYPSLSSSANGRMERESRSYAESPFMRRRLEDLPGPLGGKCRSHSPEYSAAILEDALDHIHNSSPRGNSRAAQGDENSSG